MSDIINEYIDEVRGEPIDAHEPPRGPFVEYEATYVNRKGKMELIEDIRGMQFDGGFYFLFIMIEGMPVPQVRVLDLSSPDVRDLRITPIHLIESDA